MAGHMPLRIITLGEKTNLLMVPKIVAFVLSLPLEGAAAFRARKVYYIDRLRYAFSTIPMGNPELGLCRFPSGLWQLFHRFV